MTKRPWDRNFGHVCPLRPDGPEGQSAASGLCSLVHSVRQSAVLTKPRARGRASVRRGRASATTPMASEGSLCPRHWADAWNSFSHSVLKASPVSDASVTGREWSLEVAETGLASRAPGPFLWRWSPSGQGLAHDGESWMLPELLPAARGGCDSASCSPILQVFTGFALWVEWAHLARTLS